MLGSQEIICRYVCPIVAGEPLSIPLLLPVETDQLKIVEQDLSWSSQNAIAWEAIHANSEFTSLDVLHNLKWSRPVANVTFRPSVTSVQSLPGVLVEQAWLQLWLSSQERRIAIQPFFKRHSQPLTCDCRRR